MRLAGGPMMTTADHPEPNVSGTLGNRLKVHYRAGSGSAIGYETGNDVPDCPMTDT